MTLRAFILGLIFVALVSWVEPYSSFIADYGAWFTYSSFPSGTMAVLVFLTVVVNVMLKVLKRAWALSRAELLLVFCMMFVAAAIPCEGIGRYFYQMVAGPTYLARRPDIAWDQPGGALEHAPEGLVLSKDPLSTAAEQYYLGAGETGRVPWGVWARPLLHWGLFLVPLYLAVMFMCGILRRQWVDVERLMFPLARVPLEFTEEGATDRLLPALFYNRGFLFGLCFAFAFRLVRNLPAFFGGQALTFTVPFEDVFQDTLLEGAGWANVGLNLSAIGFAFLVPADVSLSVWFFFLFTRAQTLMGQALAMPDLATPDGIFLRWQQLGTYFAFIGGMAWMARRHLGGVLRKALRLRGAPDDSKEPISHALAFWGFLLCIAWCVGWYWYHGMGPLTALAVLGLTFCWFFVYARIVSQGGLYVAVNQWSMPQVIHGLSAGRAFSPAGAVIASMQGMLLFGGRTTLMAPQTMGALRISEVFGERRRWLLPAMVVSVLVALAAMTHQVLTQAYSMGAVNFWDGLQTVMPQGAFNTAHNLITQPSQAAAPRLGALAFGSVAMGLVMFMRARFYWWPVHAIGLLAASGWHARRLWWPFFLGWLAKVGIMKLAGGRTLRQARNFFIALIAVEYSVGALSGVSQLVFRTFFDIALPGF